MQTIWKFPLQVREHFTIEMPKGADPLKLEMDKGTGKPTIWARIDSDAPMETRHIRMVGTGHAAPEGTYLGMVQMSDGLFNFVWHYFLVR